VGGGGDDVACGRGEDRTLSMIELTVIRIVKPFCIFNIGIVFRRTQNFEVVTQASVVLHFQLFLPIPQMGIDELRRSTDLIDAVLGEDE
jgi:hypothetical protein